MNLLQILQSAAQGGIAGGIPQAPPQVSRNPLQTALNVQPPTVGNAQPNYDFAPQQPDMNNPYVPEIQKLLEEIKKKNEALTKTALAASAHQAQTPQQNSNPVRPGPNKAALLVSILGELAEKGAGVKGYSAFMGAAQQAEAGRFGNEMLQHQGRVAADQGQIAALKGEIGGLEDQVRITESLSKQFEDRLQQNALDAYRAAQQEGLNERAALKGAMDALKFGLEELKFELKKREFETIKTPESAVKVQQGLKNIDLTGEKIKTEIKRRAKLDVDIKGVVSRSKLNEAQAALVGKKLANYDDEFKLRAANIYSQMAKRKADAEKANAPKPVKEASLNQERLLNEAVIRLNKAQIEKWTDLSPEGVIRLAELRNEMKDAEDRLKQLAKNARKPKSSIDTSGGVGALKPSDQAVLDKYFGKGK